jgi:hypothetical protein
MGAEMKVNATTAFSEGFKLIGREPLTVAAWAGLQLLISAMIVGAMFWFFPSNVGLLQTMASGGDRSLETAARFAGGFIGLGLLWVVLGLLFQAVVLNAVYRAVLEPAGSRSFARLRLGARELWMALHLFVYSIVIFGGIGLSLWAVGAGTKQYWLAVLLAPFLTLAIVNLFTLSGPMTSVRGGFKLFSAFGSTMVTRQSRKLHSNSDQ